MSVALSPSITGVHESLNSTGTMASKRVGLKDTIESTTEDMVKKMSMGLLMYEETRLLIDKENKIIWEDINHIFLGTFEENLEDRRVYVNIHKPRLYRVACRYLTFPYVDMIQWIVSHTALEKIVLSNVNGTKFSTFRE